MQVGFACVHCTVTQFQVYTSLSTDNNRIVPLLMINQHGNIITQNFPVALELRTLLEPGNSNELLWYKVEALNYECHAPYLWHRRDILVNMCVSILQIRISLVCMTLIIGCVIMVRRVLCDWSVISHPLLTLSDFIAFSRDILTSCRIRFSIIDITCRAIICRVAGSSTFTCQMVTFTMIK